jgi:hypothetical protein
VNTAECVPIYIDKIDQVQNTYEARNEFTPYMMEDLKQLIDAKILGEYANANSYIDDGSIGGTAGVSAVINAANINRVFAAAGKKLDNLHVPDDMRFAAVSPSVLELLKLYTGGKDTVFGDDVLANGLVGNRFGFKIYKSTNLTFTGRWTPADNPSNGATITIAGVTFTFVSSIGTTPGNVLIGASTAATLDNLVALINAPTTTTAQGVALSQDSCATLKGIVATDGTTYLGVTFVGGGEVAVTTSEVADVWSLQTVHCLFGKVGATELAMQAAPQIGFNQEPKRLPGSGNLIAWDLYGYKTWNRHKDLLVDVRVDSSLF